MADDQRELADAATELRIALSAVYRAIRHGKATEEELTLPESSALSRLNRHGPMTAAELARAEQITPQSIGVTVHALISAGLIERTADPADGRRLILAPTDAGRAVISRRRARRDEDLTRALAALPADERARLLAALPALARLADHV